MVRNNPLFEASYRRLFGDAVGADAGAAGFFDDFYQRFLAAPGIRDFFEGSDMARQATMLRKSLYHLAGFYVLGQPSGELERLARRHHQLGIGAEQYGQWLDCLVASVAAFDAECDEATLLAWRWALSPGITYMQLYGYFQDRRFR